MKDVIPKEISLCEVLSGNTCTRFVCLFDRVVRMSGGGCRIIMLDVRGDMDLGSVQCATYDSRKDRGSYTNNPTL